MKKFWKKKNFNLIRESLHQNGSRTALIPTFSLPPSGKRKEIIGLLKNERPVGWDAISGLVRSKDLALVGAGVCLMALHPKGEPGTFARMEKYYSRNPPFSGAHLGVISQIHEAQIHQAHESVHAGRKRGVEPARFPVLKYGNERAWALLAGRHPVFASEYPVRAAETARIISSIADAFSKKYGDAFTGVSVSGSFANGGWSSDMFDRSDVDYCVIAKDKVIADEFKSELNSAFLSPCSKYSGFMNQDAPIANLSSSRAGYMLFDGIFFGDKKRLRELQYGAIKQMTDQQWHSVVSEIHYAKSNLGSIESRLKLDNREKMALQAIRSLQAVPPYSRKQVLQILRKDRRFSHVQK